MDRDLVAELLSRGVEVPVAEPPRRDQDALLSIGRAIFLELGPKLVEKGWSVFPQQRDGARKPGRDRTDANSTIRWGAYAERLPTAEEAAHWARVNPTLNVAVALGRASSGILAIDIDVADEEFGFQIQRLADVHLGRTEFRRVGREPRMALIYRQEPATAADEIRSRPFWFLKERNGVVSKDGDNAIEILAHGKPITMFGVHHKTGNNFRWMGRLHPVRHPPAMAPLVDRDMMLAFLEAVAEVRPFYRNTPSIAADIQWVHDPENGLNVPRLTTLAGGTPWVEDEEGLVEDGREFYLYSLSRKVVRSNESAARDSTRRGHDQLKALVYEEFGRTARMTGRWTEDYVRTQVDEKVSRSIRESCEKNDFYRGEHGRPVAKAAVTTAIVTPEREVAFPFLQSVRKAVPGVVMGGKGGESLDPLQSRLALDFKPVELSPERVEENRRARALVPDRTEIARSVGDGIRAALDAFFADVYRERPAEGVAPGPTSVHTLCAPTGAGKTSLTIRYVAEDPRTKSFDEAAAREVAEGRTVQDRETPGPVLFLLPTYNNIAELRTRAEVLNLDGALSDEALVAQARERNLFTEDEVVARLADIRRDARAAGLRTMIYKGKKAAECKVADKLNLLMSAGIGSAGLCKASVVDKDGEREDKFCPHYSGCEAILQRKRIATSHVVFLAHAFMTLAIPEELQNVRAVIADERIFHLFLHTTSFPLHTLKRQRKEPKVTKKEREQGLDPAEILNERHQAAEVAHAALQNRDCPALALSRLVHAYPNGQTVTGAQYVDSAMRVCGNAISSSSVITPEMSYDQIRELCEAPTGAHVREEYRFWKIVRERIDALSGGTETLKRELGRTDTVAKGGRDMRIQFRLEVEDDGKRNESVRISWRTKPNWEGKPLLLLDASASPEITSKLFGGRPVVVHDCPAPLNVKTLAVLDATYSNASIVTRGVKVVDGKGHATDRTKATMRRLVSFASAFYGWGRVVVGASAVVRKAVNTSWAAPSNVDWCHYGAMRGLDFAKNHVAALSIGRMEVPVATVDGIVAALTYDDDEPEEPFDVNGDGTDPKDGSELRVPLFPNTLRMRSGHDIQVQIPCYPGRWARIVQRQYREEELKQFLGRLRPVYREGRAPDWIAGSRVIPDDVVVDDIVHMEDVVRPGRKLPRIWDAARVTDGLIHPAVLLHASPGQFKDEEDVRKEIKDFGFDLATGATGPSRWKRLYATGFTPVRITDGTGAVEFAFVRTEHPDPAGTTRLALHRWTGTDVSDLEIEVLPAPVARVAGARRDADSVDALLGSREDRAREEAELGADVSWMAVCDNGPDSFTAWHATADNRLPVELRLAMVGANSWTPRTYDEMASRLSTERMWERSLAGHLSQAPSVIPVGSVQSVATEHAADGAA